MQIKADHPCLKQEKTEGNNSFKVENLNPFQTELRLATEVSKKSDI